MKLILTTIGFLRNLLQNLHDFIPLQVLRLQHGPENIDHHCIHTKAFLWNTFCWLGGRGDRLSVGERIINNVLIDPHNPQLLTQFLIPLDSTLRSPLQIRNQSMIRLSHHLPTTSSALQSRSIDSHSPSNSARTPSSPSSWPLNTSWFL